MWVKALIKWLLMLFRWGQTALEPLADSMAAGSPPPPVGSPAGAAGRQAPVSVTMPATTTLLDLAAEVAELRSEVRALRRVLVERA
jgi:hypothetical protein